MRVLSVALVTSLLTGSLVLSGAPAATAAPLEPVPDLFTVNVADQNASSGARDYIAVGDTTYFTASNLTYGRSIWSISSTPGATAELVLDPVAGVTHGVIEKMAVLDGAIYFWLNDDPQRQGPFSAMRYDLATEAVVELVDPVTSAPITADADVYSNFTLMTGVAGDTVYLVGGAGADNAQKLYGVDAASGAVTVADTMAGYRITNQYRDGTVASGQGWHPTIVALGTRLYIADYVSTAPPGGSYCAGWGMSDWSEFRSFDTATDAWLDPIQVGGAGLFGSAVLGTVSYAGEEVVISAAATVKGCYFNHTFAYYATKADGTTTRLGTWTTNANGGAASFVNLDGSLYLMDGGLWLVDPATGERTSQNATMFPSAASVSVSNAVQVGSSLVFAARAGDYTAATYLYQWNGTGAASQLTSVALGQQIGVAPSAPSIYEWVTNASRDYQSRSAIGVVGDRAITSFHAGDSIGAEPYLIGLDDTVTLVKNLNTGSDGSSPDTDCFANFNNLDYFAGNLPVQTEPWGKDVFIELKGEEGFLKYSVVDPGDIRDLCGFVVIGESLYFTAQDDQDGDGLYRMASDRTVERLSDVPEPSEQAFTHGGDYIFRGANRYDTDWWMWDSSSGLVTQLTGTGADMIEEDSVEEAVQIGSTVYFTGSRESDGDDFLWALDLTSPTVAPTALTMGPVGSRSSSPENLLAVGGKVVYSDYGYAVDDSDAGENVMIYDPSTGAIRSLLDPEPSGDRGYVQSIFAVGNEVVTLYQADSADWQVRTVTRSTLAGASTALAFPEAFDPFCAAPAGNDIAISSYAGDAYFYRDGGETMTPIAYSFAGDPYSLCGAVTSVNGTYLSIPEYPFTDGPWANEAAYLGFLTPVAVERLGQPVQEPPASPYSSTPPPADAPGRPGTPVATAGNGVIDLSWTAPTTGGTAGGYTITSSPAGALCVIVSTSASCTGLTVGETYTFTVAAYNVNGFGSPTAASNAAVAPVGADAGFGEGGNAGDGGGTDGGGTDGGGDGGADGGGTNGGDTDDGGDGTSGSESGGDRGADQSGNHSLSGDLASTGFSAAGPLALAALLLALGAAAVVIARVRRSART